MTGINIFLAYEKEFNVVDKNKEIILNLNLWNNLKYDGSTNTYLEIGIVCMSECEGIFITIPTKLKKDNITDIHPLIKKNTNLLKLIFSTHTSSTNQGRENSPYVFTRNKELDTQFLYTKENIILQELSNDSSLLFIPTNKGIKKAGRKLPPPYSYIRIRIKIDKNFQIYSKVTQQGLQDHISIIESLEFRINDSRIIDRLPTLENEMERILDSYFRNNDSKFYMQALLKEIHLITIDPMNSTPNSYNDNYLLIPQTLEKEWHEYIDFNNKDLISHHFYFTPDKATNNSICFVKFEYKTMNKYTIGVAVVIIYILGLFTEFIASVFFK